MLSPFYFSFLCYPEAGRVRIPVEMTHALLPVFHLSLVCLSVFILQPEFCWLNHPLLNKAPISSKALFAEEPLCDNHYSSSSVPSKQRLRLFKKIFFFLDNKTSFLEIKNITQTGKKNWWPLKSWFSDFSSMSQIFSPIQYLFSAKTENWFHIDFHEKM